MKKSEYFGLTFLKVLDPFDAKPRSWCTRKIVGPYSHLTMLNQLCKFEVEGLLDDITETLSGRLPGDYFFSDGVGCDSVLLLHQTLLSIQYALFHFKT